MVWRASKNVVFKQLRLQGIYSAFILKEFRCFKNGFNFKYISSYKNWFKQRFKDLNLTEPMIIKSPAAQHQSEPQTYMMHTDRHSCPPLWSFVFWFVFPFRSFMFLLGTRSSVLCVHTAVQISVKHLPASWRSGPWEYGNTPVHTASHKSNSPGGVTQRPQGYSTPE